MLLRTIKALLASREADDGLWTGEGDDMLALHGTDGRFARVSDSTQSVTGHMPAALIGQPLSTIVVPQDRGVVFAALSQAAFGEGKGRAEFRILKKDGTVSWGEMTVSRDARGRLRTVIRDIAQRQARQLAQNAACVQAEAKISAHTNYLADISHEIRTPLNAVIGFAEMMRQETFGPLGHPKYEEYAGLIHTSGQHLLSLVSGLLDLSKIEAERYRVERSATDLSDLLRECAEMSRIGAETAGLDLIVDLQDMAGPVMVDPKVIRQIVLNLLSNAVKFTERGSVEVRLRHDRQTIWISVLDTGIGMSRDQLDNVGRRFTAAQRDGVRGTRGTGLGLALCDALARLHDGSLRLASREGLGTRSVLCIPYIPVREPLLQDEDDGQVERPHVDLGEEGDFGSLDALRQELETLAGPDENAGKGDTASPNARHVA